ncbi:MAG: kelch repeat-containing protein [Planctomycetota bacterium]
MMRVASLALLTVFPLACSGDADRPPLPPLRAVWTELPAQGPTEQFGNAMAYDTVAQRALLCAAPALDGAGMSVWEWDGSSWSARQLLGGPSSRTQQAVAFDSARGRLVLFGGFDQASRQELDDTWELDGDTWREVFPPQRPPARFGHHLVYDEARARLVLYAGLPREPSMRNVWEWDGTNWAERATTLSPPGELETAMVYDSWRRRVVLFGTHDAPSTEPGQTWAWDGTTWELRGTNGPTFRSEPALVFDPTIGRAVLLGGMTNTHPRMPRYAEDVWEWDGNAWEERALTAPGIRLAGTQAVFDPVRRVAVAFGGRDIEFRHDDTWELLGTEWQRVVEGTLPSERSGHALAYDEDCGRLVVFGGLIRDGLRPLTSADTWEWSAAGWMRRSAFGPPPRTQAGMVYDSARRRVLLFGGRSFLGGLRGDTWEWDGAEWVKRTSTPAPPARYDHAMANDRRRERVVLFGGWDAATRFGDTWEWDGSTWTELQLGRSPSPRGDHAMAYDEGRGVVVLFGGWDGATRGDTWEFDGSHWTERVAATPPAPRSGHRLVYDAIGGRVVMSGGFPETGDPGATWEWDGRDWRRNVNTGPAPLVGHGMTYDRGRGRVLLFGGGSLLGSRSLWTYALPPTLARIGR